MWQLLCSAATAWLQTTLVGHGERRWLGTAATETGVARWEPMGAREYYDYRRAIYGNITHKAILVDVVGTLLAPTESMAQFTKEYANKIEEVKLRVTYVAPPQPPSPVPEESEEGSPSRVSKSENGDGPARGFTRALRERIEPQEKSLEAGALISKLTEEKNSTIQQNHKIRQELVCCVEDEHLCFACEEGKWLIYES